MSLMKIMGDYAGKKSSGAWPHAVWVCGLVVFVLSLSAAKTSAQCVEQQKLTASDARDRDRFGISVSLSGDVAAMGCLCGSVSMFRFNGTSWIEEQKLIAFDENLQVDLGSSISVSGDTVIVGASLADCTVGINCGAAYVYRFNGTRWIQEQKLTASDSQPFDRLGGAVNVNGNTALVGQSRANCAGGNNCAAVYIFRFNGTSWVEVQKLTTPDAFQGGQFGGPISQSGNTIVMGASQDSCATGIFCGSAFIYGFNGTQWVEQQKLTAADAMQGDDFGHSVSVSGNTILVGAPGAGCPAGNNCGSSYVFRFNGSSWIEEQKLTVSDADDNRFGISVSVSGNMAVVGAFLDDCTAGIECGSAYLFWYNGIRWVEVQKLTASDAGWINAFGISISMSRDRAMVGAWAASCGGGVRCGAAYIFSCTSAPTIANLDIKPDSCPNPVNPTSKGVLPVTLVGSIDFDVTMVDLDSLTLARGDGVGESITPLSNRRGPRIDIEDVTTPVSDEPCMCHNLSGDGIDDLSLKFSTAVLSRAFMLNTLPDGETIELVLRGTLQDGTTLEATDCIVIPGTPRDTHQLRRTKRSK